MAFPRFPRCVSILALLALGACAAKPSGPPAVVGSVWEVRKGESVGHLVASLHAGVGRELVLSGPLEAVIAGSGVVAFEALPAEAADPSKRPKVVAVYYRATAESLESELGPVLAVRVKRVLEAYNAPAGSWEALRKLRLNFVPPVMTAAVGIGAYGQWWAFIPGPTKGLDGLIAESAKRAGRPFAELESDTAVNRARMRLTNEELRAEIDAIVSRLETLPAGTIPVNDDGVIAAVLDGDVETSYARHRARYCAPPLLDRVCDKTADDRNEDMAARFEALMADGKRPLGVTGAHHLAGPKSLLVHLASRGYAVKRLDR